MVPSVLERRVAAIQEAVREVVPGLDADDLTPQRREPCSRRSTASRGSRPPGARCWLVASKTGRSGGARATGPRLSTSRRSRARPSGRPGGRSTPPRRFGTCRGFEMAEGAISPEQAR